MTKIEWTNKTWNPVTGCTKISLGCTHCYAERMATRLAGRFGYPAAPHQFDVTFHEDRLRVPFHWRKPRMIFVSSMGDLFHEHVTDLQVLKVLAVIRACPQHTFQILTKRPERMADLTLRHRATHGFTVIPNLWLGVSVEDPLYLWRINELIQCPAPVRFVSLEPLLAPIDLCPPVTYPRNDLLIDHLQWVIVGGESGPGARPMHPAWAQHLSDQCQASAVPFFFKQWGAWGPLRSILASAPNFQSRRFNGRKELITYRSPGQAGPPSSGIQHTVMYRVGKKRAGRLLDGRERNEMPVVQPIPYQEVTNG
jgi:protein gp37